MRKFWRSLTVRLHAVLTSIRFRLTLWFAVILGVVLLVFGVFVYTLEAHDLQRATLDRLANKIRQLQSSDQFARREPFENSITIPNISQDAGPLLQQDDILAVTDPQGQVVQKYGPISSQDVNQLAGVGINRAASQSPFSYTLVSATATDNRVSQQYTFIVAPISFSTVVIGYLILGSPVDPDGQLHRLLFALLTGGLGTLVVALAGGYWLADRAMRPVKTITQAARQISETDLSRRLNLSSNDEIGQLAKTFDQMLARLQAAFERQRQFTADASHELRTPLTIVNLEASRALAAHRTSAEYESALSVILSENEWMTRLVNNLLTLSRMDAGQTVLQKETVDLSDLALEVVERLAPIAARSQVNLSTGDLPELLISGDRQFLSQMITNLVENAIKYTTGPEKCVRVVTGLDQQDQGAFGWVSVQDNGPGIAPEHLPRLFDRFYQVDKSRAHDADELSDPSPEAAVSSGSGLGLSIVHWIARAHGGEVKIQSEVGKGSTFTIRLPLVKETRYEKMPA